MLKADNLCAVWYRLLKSRLRSHFAPHGPDGGTLERRPGRPLILIREKLGIIMREPPPALGIAIGFFCARSQGDDSLRETRHA
jgi:hypothetical protein